MGILKSLSSTLIVCSLLFFGCDSKQHDAGLPNIIYILADDLGYGEIGIQGQSIIKTPHIDALAATGMRFTNHYSGAPVCAPARCILLTGMHAGHAYVRGNDEWAERGDVWDYKKAVADPRLEGQRPIPDETVTIAELFQEAGYTTSIFGKWGLGAPGTIGVPNRQGFDKFYGYNCQRQAHNLYPPHLWDNDKKVLLRNDVIAPRTKLDSLDDPQDPASYAKFTQEDYAPALIHEEALSFIDAHTTAPFFMYYASPLPHLPLQAPHEDVDAYRTLLGAEDVYLGDKGYFPTPFPRATYAAMISHLDRQVGELVQSLKDNGIYENTVIIFSSDNGPTYTGGVDFDYFESSAPFTNGYGRTKGYVYEGGIRVPMIVSWPGRIAPASTSEHISAFYDVLPTLCDISGIDPPQHIDGVSFKPTLLGQEQPNHDFLYWEFPSYQGQQAVRMGNWKAIRKDIQKGNLDIELYDLSADIQEQQNVAVQHPDIIKRMEVIMKEEHTVSGVKKFQFAALGDMGEE